MTKAKLVVEGLPDLLCFTDMKDLVSKLETFLSVDIPQNITNVTVSNIQPTDSETNNIWIRTSNSGSFIGIYVFVAGTWKIIYPINTSHVTQIFWITSDDGSVPDGFEKVTLTSTAVPPNTIAGIMAQYIQDPTSTYDQFFAVYFLGF